jgi:hypothetical protein
MSARFVKIRVLLTVVIAIFSASFSWAEIGIGDSRDEVLRQFGKPTSIAKRGQHEIFLYPKGGRIEFVGGKVADVKGPLPTPVAATPTTPVSAAPANPPAEKTSPPTPTAPAKAPAPKAPSPTEPSDDYNPAVAANELAKHVEKMDTPWGATPAPVETHSPLESIPSFLTGLLLRFGFTILALKLAFKYWEMDAFWKGILAIAGIDLAVHALFILLGPVTGGFTTLGPVENGIPGLVLIYTVHRFCFNKRIQNAVLTAAAVKVVVTLCYVFAGLAALNMIYG